MDLFLIIAVILTGALASRALADWKGLNKNLFTAMGLLAGAIFVPVALLWPIRNGHTPAPGKGGHAIATSIVWAAAFAALLMVNLERI